MMSACFDDAIRRDQFHMASDMSRSAEPNLANKLARLCPVRQIGERNRQRRWQHRRRRRR